MYLKQAFVVSVVALFPAVLANITCETTDGSPDTSDVTDSINDLNGMGSDCPQDNDQKSHCSTYASVGSSAIAVCGTDSDMQCSEVGKHALDIQNECLNFGKVGGTAHLASGVRVEVIHS